MDARPPAPCPLAPTFVKVTEATVRRHQHDVWRHLRFLGAPPPVADDLTQEAFLRLLQVRLEERGDDALAAWLRTTARNLFLSRQRRRAGLELRSEAELEQAWLRWQTVAGGDGGQAALERCLQRLEGRARQALWLRYGEGRERAEVAAALQLGVEALKSLLRRSKRLLLACVRGPHDEGRR